MTRAERYRAGLTAAIVAVVFGALALTGALQGLGNRPADAGHGSHRPATPVEYLGSLIDRAVLEDATRATLGDRSWEE